MKQNRELTEQERCLGCAGMFMGFFLVGIIESAADLISGHYIAAAIHGVIVLIAYHVAISFVRDWNDMEQPSDGMEKGKR